MSPVFIADCKSAIFCSDWIMKVLSSSLLSSTSAVNVAKSGVCDSSTSRDTTEETISNSSLMENGLWMESVNPPFMNASFSPSPRAVMATIGIVCEFPMLDLRSNARISKPLVSGICMSLSSKS